MKNAKSTDDKIKELKWMDWKEEDKYALMGNNFERYYYFEDELFCYRSDTDGYNTYYYKIYLSTLKNAIVEAEKEHSNSSDWDTTKAKQVIALHEKELYEEEVNYYLDQVIEAMQKLENVDSNIKCTITRADEVIEVSNQKVLRKKNALLNYLRNDLEKQCEKRNNVAGEPLCTYSYEQYNTLLKIILENGLDKYFEKQNNVAGEPLCIKELLGWDILEKEPPIIPLRDIDSTKKIR